MRYPVEAVSPGKLISINRAVIASPQLVATKPKVSQDYGSVPSCKGCFGSGFSFMFPQSQKIQGIKNFVIMTVNLTLVHSSVADPDPGSGIGCLFDPRIRDPGWVESQHPDPGSGMKNPDHIF